MKRSAKVNDGWFSDAAAIQRSLERHTRNALLRRHGSTLAADMPLAAERAKARGIGFAVDLVRAIRDGQKTQTRRPIRPQPESAPLVESCPIAWPGELLYVREPWLRTGDGHVLYAADEPPHTRRKFKPGMYMPRDLARLWLRVKTVRAERLSAMSAADLAAEGLPAGQSFEQVWNSFYNEPGKRFADDPWVWVIGFVVAGNDATIVPSPGTPGEG